ncbi:MAG: biopolymer transporter ExbD [Gimesia sp.]|nr:biopolymer transporter ExbD [Gimesia sp.]
MPIKFYCKKCGQRLSVASKKAGKSVSCPACRNQITIPPKSQPRRPDNVKDTPETTTDTEKHSQPVAHFNPEENQLLDGLGNLGELGDSWDEILEDDWKEALETEEADQPADEAQTQQEEIAPEKSKSANQPDQPPQKNILQPEAEADSLPPEPETTPVTETAPADPKQKTLVEQSTAPHSTVTYSEDEEDDEDDEDEGFSIRSADSEFDEMDLTPMVDVTFLLLIFFMITASFSLQKSIQVPPPNPDEDGVSQSLQTLDDFREESIIVEIDNNNGIYVDDTKLSNPTEIVQAILDRRNQDGKTKSELVLSAHKAARHETVVAVVDAANEVGMQKIRLASYRGPED